MVGKLILADGTVYTGRSCGIAGQTSGETVFTTNMGGYQETLTDPSYHSQIVIMTYPLIGNYGINSHSNQSDKPQVSGFIAREFCEQPSHWQSYGSIISYFKHHQILAIDSIDTRALAKHLRNRGTMAGLIACGDDLDEQQLIKQAKQLTISTDQVSRVSTKQSYQYNSTGTIKLAVVDLGVKKTILDNLTALDCQLTVYPYTVTADQLLKENYQGIVFTNGPGDPKNLPGVIKTIKQIAGHLPILGICLGHQLICLAAGADTYKLSFGHRGSNQPVKDLSTGKIALTTQNHGYAVSEQTLTDTGLQVTHRNLNDGTVEGVSSITKQLISVQYHPDQDQQVYLNFLKLVNPALSQPGVAIEGAAANE